MAAAPPMFILVLCLAAVANACNPFTLETSRIGPAHRRSVIEKSLSSAVQASSYISRRSLAANPAANKAPPSPPAAVCTCLPETSVCGCSPYRLSGPVVTPLSPNVFPFFTGTRFCFTIQSVGCGITPLPCCITAATAPLEQVLLNVGKQCTGRFVDYTVNGQSWLDSGVDGPYPKSSVVYFNNLGLSLLTAAGTQLCVATTDQTHGCRTAVSGQPYSLSPLAQVASGVQPDVPADEEQSDSPPMLPPGPWATYCTTVSLRWGFTAGRCSPGEPSSQCCGMNFEKLETLIDGACRRSIFNMTVNGVFRERIISPYSQWNAVSFKWTAMDLSPTQASSTTFCFTAVGSCADLSVLALQGRLQAAVFDPTHTCCPTFFLYTGRHRRLG
eukprot:XP_001697347.1 predicted protein [Chlamydomonas reinhardtii]